MDEETQVILSTDKKYNKEKENELVLNFQGGTSSMCKENCFSIVNLLYSVEK